MKGLPSKTKIMQSAKADNQKVVSGLPYSAGHAVQIGVLPRTGKAKVTDLDEGRLLPIKQCVVKLHITARHDRCPYRLVQSLQNLT